MNYILGIDLGSQSLGWSILECDSHGNALRFVDWGSRIFDDGRKAKNNEPLSVERRRARSARRRRDRFKRRKEALISLLTARGFLPKTDEERRNLKPLDPYELRHRGVSEKLTPYELGRALLHLNQHRGFKSNRKADRSEDKKETSSMKTGIADLEKKLGGKTLGQYLHERRAAGKPIRFRPDAVGSKSVWEIYPSRKMYEEELNRLLDAQANFHTGIDSKFRDGLHRIIIQQRPLKSPPVGKCRFLEGEFRAHRALPLSQEFRIYQEVNNLRLAFDGGNEEPLRENERDLLLDQLLLRNSGRSLLDKKGRLSFRRIRRTLVRRDLDFDFNLEQMGRDGLDGNLTDFHLGKKDRFGEAWGVMNPQDKEEIVMRLAGASRGEKSATVETDEDLTRWLVRAHGVSAETASNILAAPLPDFYGRLSARAMELLLPRMRGGLRYDEACALEFGHHSAKSGKLTEKLPYYGEVLEEYVLPPSSGEKENHNNPETRYGRIPNPTVHIALNQLRRVVNAVMEKHGKPMVVRVELARDLPASARQLGEMKKRQTDNRNLNVTLRDEIVAAGHRPNSENLERLKLWKELKEIGVGHPCPFTGKSISKSLLFSDKVEIEHILPFSLTFDDSIANKTLCFREANRRKGNQTPFEAFGADAEQWREILSRVRDLPENKRWRFQENAMERFLKKQPDLIARTLNDTRYLSRAARGYLGSICKNVEVIHGGFTWLLRKKWGFKKDRGDHRHHAIDAFVVACATPSLLHLLQKRLREHKETHPDINALRLPGFPQPYPDFSPGDMKNRIQTLVVSHRPDTFSPKVYPTGQLHEETYFGLVEKPDGQKKESLLVVRKPLLSLKQEDLSSVRDPLIRNELEKDAPAPANKEKWQQHLRAFSRKTGVRRVRVLEKASTATLVPLDNGKRWAKSGSNAFADIVLPNGRDSSKALFEVVPLWKSCDPKFEPEWKRNHPGARKAARLSRNETVALQDADGKWRLYRVREFATGSSPRIFLLDITTANPPKHSKKLSKSDVLGGRFFKVAVGVLGDVRAPAAVLSNLAHGTILGD